jgi:hypothetical protein
MHQIRPFSWILAAVILYALLAVGRSYFDNPLLFVGGFFLSLLGAVVAGTLIWVVIAWVRDKHLEKRRYERQRAGCCVICGYDVRTLDGKCPECGFPISRPFVAAPQVKRSET